MEPPGLNPMDGGDDDEIEYTEMQMGQGYPQEMDDQEIDENGDYSQFAFPSFSPTSKKRVRLRKPNFSEDCLELLIQLVNEHRDILYTKQAYTSEIHEKKIMVWTHITSQINAISSIPRTMEEVRKKWNDYSYYVKKKRENEKRGIHYTAHTNLPGNTEEPAPPVEYDEEPGGKTTGRDHRRIRNREDRVLAIVDGAHRDIAGGTGTDPMGANDNISSLLLDACQRAREEANYAGVEVDTENGSENPSGSNSPSEFPQEFPKLKAVKHDPNRVPPLPNPINKYAYSRGRYARGATDVRRSNRVRTPVKDVYTPTASRGRGRGRGRPPGPAGLSPSLGLHSGGGSMGYTSQHSQQQVMVTGFDEDLVHVNRQRLAIERRRLIVEKRRLKIERRRLQIEEERFKWQQIERKGMYPDEDEEEEETQDEGEQHGLDDDIQETGHQNGVPNGLVNQLPPTSSPMKYESQSPDHIQQPHSPVVTPALTPGDVSF